MLRLHYPVRTVIGDRVLINRQFLCHPLLSLTEIKKSYFYGKRLKPKHLAPALTPTLTLPLLSHFLFAHFLKVAQSLLKLLVQCF